MAASSSSDEHLGSEDEQEQPGSDSQGSGQHPASQGRRAHQTKLGSQQAVTTLERSLPSRGRPLNESDQVLQTGTGTTGQGKSGAAKGPSQRISHQPKSHRSRSSKSRRKEAKQYLSTAYRDLLNIDIEHARQRASSEKRSLVSSQVGGSYWSAHEKHKLFRRMERSGSHDLPSLCQAVPTKSLAEIKAYLLLLDARASGSITDGAPVEGINISDVPAAWEMSSDCESALHAAAVAIECHVHDHDVKAERMMNGDEWLVDVRAADQIELEYEKSLEQQDDAEGALDSTSTIDQADSRPTSVAAIAKPECLLRPVAFLDLSSNLFMNNGEDKEQNWHHLDALSRDADEPAMFRSTLQDLHDLTISLTRRLVQVVIFQALTRLRAEDSSRKDWTPAAAVRDTDVHSALDMLNMPRNAERYWASCARRCRLGVYSDSKKFADGRPGTKQGRLLSYDEVETELGQDSPRIHDDIHPNEDFDAEDVDDVLHDTEMFTDANETDRDADDYSGDSKPVRLERKRPRKRKRALSPRDFCRAETTYLEAIDRHASIAEEKRLRKLLHIDAADDADVSRSQLPPKPGPIPAALAGNLGWREEVEDEAEWEQSQGHIAAEAFHRMEAAGQVGGKRRKAMKAEVERRLQEEANLPLDDGKDEHESGEDGDEHDDDDDDDTASSDSNDVILSDQESAATVERSDSAEADDETM